MPSVAILVGHRGGKRAARFPGTRGWRKELVDEAGIKTCSGRVLANLLEVADVDGVLQRPGDGGFSGDHLRSSVIAARAGPSTFLQAYSTERHGVGPTSRPRPETQRPATDLRGALRCDSERGRPGRRNMRPRRFKNPREQLHELCLSLLPAWSAAAGLQQMGADKPTQLMLVKPGSRASARRSIRAAFIGTAAAFAAPTKIRTPSRRGRTRRPRSSSIRLDLRGTLVGHGPEGQHACSGDFSSPRAQGSRAVPSN